MFQDVVWFFDNASLAILCFLGYTSYRFAEALAKIRQTPFVFALSGFATLAQFIHLYQRANDASLDSLWEPIVRAAATGAVTLFLLMSFVIVMGMIWQTHFPPVTRLAKSLFKFARSIRQRYAAEPIFPPEPPPIPLPTRSERLASQVKHAEEEYHSTVGLIGTAVSSLDEDEEEEIEFLAKRKLLSRLDQLLGDGNDR